MFVKCFFIVASLLLISGSAAAELSDYRNDDELLSMSHRELQTITEPAWFNRVAAEDTTGVLKRCSKRTVPPVNGSICSRKPKLCYFDTQDCYGVGAHPATKCFCDGKEGSQTWNCETEVCPVFPDPTKTGCGPVVNDPTCPATGASGTCSAIDNPVTCYYGQSEW